VQVNAPIAPDHKFKGDKVVGIFLPMIRRVRAQPEDNLSLAPVSLPDRCRHWHRSRKKGINMTMIDLAERRVRREVDRLFHENRPGYGERCENPITGGRYVGRLDPTAAQKQMARRALLARDWFTVNGPPDALPLPLSGIDIEDRKYTCGKQASLDYIVSCFAYSLMADDYDFTSHPSFEDFAHGVMASEHAPDFVKKDEELRRRYPPLPLPALNAGHCWARPKGQARTTARK
jgi:hypothetical protein